MAVAPSLPPCPHLSRALSFQLIGSLSCARLCKCITPQQCSAAAGRKKKCLQPPLFCSTSPIEGRYDVLIKKKTQLTGAMHNLLSSVTLWPLGGQLRMGQCLLSQLIIKGEGSLVGKLEESPRCATDAWVFLILFPHFLWRLKKKKKETAFCQQSVVIIQLAVNLAPDTGLQLTGDCSHQPGQQSRIS